MGFVTNFEYDLFISYAHVDNLTYISKAEGWIKQFYTSLEVKLAQRFGRVGMVKIWWDKRRLDGGVLFDQTIQNAINKSAIFLALTSPGYLESEYCRRELREFYKKAKDEPLGLTINNRPRILNLLLRNIVYEDWPKEYGRTSGFEFYDIENKEGVGEPSDPKEKLFVNQLYVLIEAIHDILKNFQMYMLKERQSTQDDGTFKSQQILSEIQKTVLLDFHLKDYKHVLEIDNYLKKKGLQTLSSPDEDDPKSDLKVYEDRLMRSGSMIIFCGEVNEFWVQERIKTALQIILVKNCPTKLIGVYLPPQKKLATNLEISFGEIQMNLIDNSKEDAFNPQVLENFLKKVDQV